MTASVISGTTDMTTYIPKRTDQPLIQARRISHATLETPDLDRQIAYYTEVNGLALIAREKDHAHFASRIGQDLGRPSAKPSVLAGICPSGSAPHFSGGGRIVASIQGAV